LQKHAEEISAITIRGYDEKCRPEAELSKYKIGVHLLADYCPTDRYLYISKRMPEVRLEETWKGLQGRVIEDVYLEMYDLAKNYVGETSIRSLAFDDWIQSNIAQITEKKREQIEGLRGSLARRPTDRQVESFCNELDILAKFELQVFSSYMRFLISKKFSVNLKTEFLTNFDFIFKHSVNGTRIGLADNIKPDFLYLRTIIGDIKTGSWEEFFRVMIAAYAMAYEASENTEINCGIVLNPTFHSARTVPLYANSSIFVINDVLRKAFLAKRDQKLRVLEEENIPETPSDSLSCRDCGYFDHCCRGTP
jgi:CRISPR/Cas system-associated exonuclease Cas4 (RecB family)